MDENSDPVLQKTTAGTPPEPKSTGKLRPNRNQNRYKIEPSPLENRKKQVSKHNLITLTVSKPISYQIYSKLPSPAKGKTSQNIDDVVQK